MAESVYSRIAAGLVAIALLTLCANSLFGKAASEYEVKAAFLYNFARFVEWPSKCFPDANTPLTIGVLDSDNFARTLEKVVEGKRVGGRKIVVKRFKRVNDIDGCHILFVSSSSSNQLSDILDQVKGDSTLLVGESERFAHRGGMINFVVENKKITFEINNEAARKAGLKISSKLLKLAKVIND